MDNRTELNPRRWAVKLALTIGVALLFLAALLWGLRGVTPAHADAATRYVDGAAGSDDSDCTNPAAPCVTIGYALGLAGNGDEIRVAAGTYTETLDIAITVTLKGGYTVSGTLWLPRTGETIVDADGADDAVISIYPHANVTVEGLTLQGANHVTPGDEGGGIRISRATAVISDTVIQNNSTSNGGGIYVEAEEENPASLLLINSSLLTNTASGDGGGLYTAGWPPPTVTLQNVDVRGNTAQNSGGGIGGGWATITNCRIVSNTAEHHGGGIALNRAFIYNSVIHDNQATSGGGGGIGIDHGGLHLQGSVVSNNHNGEYALAVEVGSALFATILDTMIVNNENGGVAPWSTPFTLTNVLIADNGGHGIVGDEIPLTGTLTNVTIADNGENGINMTGADVRVVNSILWGNGGLDNNCTGNCAFTYSDIGDGGASGEGNISADPLFVDALNGDYHLGVGSPCIDKGTSVGAPTHDIEGVARDTAPDMGAYEWTGFRIFLPLALRNFGP